MAEVNHEFQMPTATNSVMTARLALLSGRMILTMICRSFAPSSRADSSSASGSPMNDVLRMTMLKVLKAVHSRIESRVLMSPSLTKTRYVGIRPPLKSIVNTINIMTAPAGRNRFLEST